MAFQVYWNEFNFQNITPPKPLMKVINSKLPNIEEKPIESNKMSHKESMDVTLPKSIQFIHDDINQQWMQSKMRKYEHEYGVNISVIGNDNWLPTPYDITMANAICKSQALNNFFTNKNVLELGGGIGNHSVLILKQNPNKLTITETSETRMNITRNTLNCNKINSDINIQFIIGEWLNLNELKKEQKNDKFDVIITNPPFVNSGKRNRRYFIDELIFNSWRYLKDNGYLIFIQSSMALIEQTIYRLKQNGYDDINIVYATKYYWNEYYFKDETFINEADENLKFGYNSYQIDYEDHDKRIETLYVVIARLKSY